MNRILNTIILAVAIFLVGNWLWATTYPTGVGGADLSAIDESLLFTANTFDIGTSSLQPADIYVGDEIEHGGDTNTRIQFFPDEIWFYAGRTTTLLKLSEVAADFVQISGGGEDTDFMYSSTAASNAFFCDDGLEECTFSIAMGFEANAGGILTVTLDGATACSDSP